jgi:clan AA aspartic protease
MGKVYAQITLKNVADMTLARKGLMSEKEIREETVETLVDTGSMSFVVTNELAGRLGLTIIGQKEAKLADDTIVNCKITDSVEINWEDRSCIMSLMVVDGASENLLGLLPLEAMDLIVDPVNLELRGAHGDKALIRV